MSDSRIILAVDFDGTLHPIATIREPLFCRMGLLSTWLREHAHVDVIISSSWRETRPQDELRRYFAQDLQHRVIGETPFVQRLYGAEWARTPAQIAACRYERQHEIECWMLEHRPGGQWLALDDDARLFEPECRRLCPVNPRTGIKPGVMFRLTRMVSEISA